MLKWKETDRLYHLYNSLTEKILVNHRELFDHSLGSCVWGQYIWWLTNINHFGFPFLTLHFLTKVLALVALPGLRHENPHAFRCLGGPAPEASSVVGRRHDVILRINDITFWPRWSGEVRWKYGKIVKRDGLGVEVEVLTIVLAFWCLLFDYLFANEMERKD